MSKIFLLSLLVFMGVAAAESGDIEHGKEVYAANCAQCHSVHMTGGLGRDFNLESYTRSVESIKKYVRDPESMYAEFGYSANAMPTLPLSAEDIEDVAAYIDSLQPFKKWMVRKRASE